MFDGLPDVAVFLFACCLFGVDGDDVESGFSSVGRLDDTGSLPEARVELADGLGTDVDLLGPGCRNCSSDESTAGAATGGIFLQGEAEGLGMLTDAGTGKGTTRATGDCCCCCLRSFCDTFLNDGLAV